MKILPVGTMGELLFRCRKCGREFRAVPAWPNQLYAMPVPDLSFTIMIDRCPNEIGGSRFFVVKLEDEGDTNEQV